MNMMMDLLLECLESTVMDPLMDSLDEKVYLAQMNRNVQIKVDPTKYVLPPKDELRAKLTDMQLRVTQDAATEPPFRNEFYDNEAEGIYVDVATGEPLFSTTMRLKESTSTLQQANRFSLRCISTTPAVDGPASLNRLIRMLYGRNRTQATA